MLKANELMIGNLVKATNDEAPCPYKINGQEIDYAQSDEQRFEPIPLHSERLKQFGFVTQSFHTILNIHDIDLGRNRKLSVGCPGTPNEIVFITEEEKKEVKAVIVLRNYDYDGPTYLHDLQNIYQLITKRPLERNKK